MEYNKKCDGICKYLLGRECTFMTSTDGIGMTLTTKMFSTSYEYSKHFSINFINVEFRIKWGSEYPLITSFPKTIFNIRNLIGNDLSVELMNRMDKYFGILSGTPKIYFMCFYDKTFEANILLSKGSFKREVSDLPDLNTVRILS